MPFKSKKRLKLLLLALPLLSGCATFYNPVTGRREILLIDTQSEVSLGRNMDAKISAQMPISPDPAENSRLDNIGNRLARFSERKDLAYRFKVVKKKGMNAFAIPGGFIYVHEDLMRAATDDELAGVVAHEMGHIVARHSVKQLQAVLGYQVLMSIALGSSGQFAVNQAIDIVFNLITMGYSRKDEYEADKLSVRYICQAGYNPYAIVTFFQKLQKEGQSGNKAPLPFLSTHPPTKDRIQMILDEIKINPC